MSSTQPVQSSASATQAGQPVYVAVATRSWHRCQAEVSATRSDEAATEKEYEAFDQHQASAPRLGFAEEARTILDVAR